MVNDANYKDEGEVPLDYTEINLCIEWGISWREFLETPDEIIGKALEYKYAESQGLKRKQSKK